MTSEYQFKTVAIAGGTGGVGTFITDAFLADKGFKVKILTRKDTVKGSEKVPLIERFKSAGADIVVTDDDNNLADLLKGVDVVVSAYGGAAMSQEYKLLDAAKKAGVKRFVPSYYGCDPRQGLEDISPVFKVRIEFNKVLFESGLEWTIILTGAFTDIGFTPMLGFDFPNKKVSIVGDGNVPVAFTHRKDVARLVVAALKNPSKSKNTYVAAPTEQRTWLEVVKDFNVPGVQVTHRTIEDVQKAIANNPNPWEAFVEQFLVIAALGKAKMFNHSNPADFPVPNRITIAQFAKSQRN